MSNGSLIEGIGVIVQVTGKRKHPSAEEVQAAIDQAGAAYRQRFGVPPSHVALPSDSTIALDALQLYTLSLARPGPARVVIVGRPVNGGTPRRDKV